MCVSYLLNIFFRYVAHTVGPRYNVKYKTAAESALYMCYRNVLGHARLVETAFFHIVQFKCKTFKAYETNQFLTNKEISFLGKWFVYFG